MLCSVVRQQVLDDESLLIVLCKVESILNDCPISPSSDDPNDLEALTPNHILQLRSNPVLPPGQWCSLVFCSEHTVIFPSLTRPKATPHKHYTNVFSMHLHVTDSILKDCLCDINMSI